MSKYNKIKSCKGFTFIEIVFALFILAVVLVGYSQIFSTATNASGRANHEFIATNLAAGLMAEIMARDFMEPGSDPDSINTEEAASRYLFDDVDDYDGWMESPPKTIGNPGSGGYLDMDGTQGTPNYSSFTRSVAVTFSRIDGNDIVVDAGPTEYKHVTVTVSSPFGKDVSIVELKSDPK